MLKVILLSFFPPKIFTLYLYELVIIISSLKAGLKTKFVWRRFKKLNILGSYLFISILFFSFQFFMLLFKSSLIGELLTKELIFLAKMVLYFLFFPLFFPLALAKNFKIKINLIFFLFFSVSVVILLLAMRHNPLSSMLWKANEFGNRFVGFTGSSFGLDGFELVGSTANSVGILYVLFFNYFLNKERINYVLVFLSALGSLLSFSQSAVLVLLSSILIYLFLNPRNVKFLTFIVVIGLVISFYAFTATDLFFRLQHTLSDLSTGQIPASLNDRLNQWNGAFHYISECPSSLIIGFTNLDPNTCGNVNIYESYFLDIVAKFGLIGLAISMVHLFVTIRLWNKSISLKMYSFWVPWVFSFTFLNDTFRTDFILFFIFSIWLADMVEIEKYGRK